MKYKVGDKVRIRSDLKIGEKYGKLDVFSDMAKFKGQEVIINEVSQSGNYYIAEVGYYYTEEMLEDVLMTNFDKVKEELALQDIQKDNSAQFTLCNVIHKVKNERDCTDRSCSECVRWLEAEYKPGFKLVVVLTEAERTILQNVDKKYKYIARDKNGNLCLYKDRPTKGISTWINGGITMHRGVFSHLFQFVQWEDEQPYNIEELLEGNMEWKLFYF